MTILQIAYKNQRDPQTAGYSPDDCGPTCLAMLLATTGHDLTVDSMYMNPSSPIRGNRGDLFITDLVKLGTAYGLPVRIQTFTLETLRQSIDAGKPVICLIFYGPIVQAGLNCVPCLQNGNWG